MADTLYSKPTATLQVKEGFKNQRAIVLPAYVRSIMEHNDISRSLFITDIGHFPEAKGHYIYRPEGAAEHILIHCTSGNGIVKIDDKSFRMSANTAIIIEAGKPHLYYADTETPWSIYWMHFDGKKSKSFKNIFNFIINIENKHQEINNDRIFMFEELYQTLEKGYDIRNLEYSSCCLWRYISSFRYTDLFGNVDKNGSLDKLDHAIEYMKENVSKNPSLKEIADTIGLSPSHFGRMFKAKTGYSTNRYLILLKMQLACKLLDYSDMSIKEISYELGFFDQYHFSKYFSRHIGMPPSKYRKTNKG